MRTYSIEQVADWVDTLREIEVPRLIELYIRSLSLVYDFHPGLEAEHNLLYKEFWRKMSPM